MAPKQSPKSVLVLFAHPAFQKSVVHKELVRSIIDLEFVTFHDLYEEYPRFNIDVKREQDLLSQHDIIVFQHPFYWYSTPSILKEWTDLVLEHGWAYGKDGNALQGKELLSVISAGGPEKAYQKRGFNRFTVKELLAPIEQTAFLCGMEYHPPFVVHGSLGLDGSEAGEVGLEYRAILGALSSGKLSVKKTAKLKRLNQDTKKLLGKSNG